MDNQVTLTLTEDELCLLQTSLQMSLQSYDVFVKQNGEDKLDYQSIKAIQGIKELYDWLEKEYF